MEGTTMQSRHGVTFHVFLKIPFAKPPTDELRFKDPLPNDPWPDILNGTEYGPAWSQLEGLIPTSNITEDCLHLNVLTSNLPESGAILKAVIVYIHGGVFEQGSAIISSPSIYRMGTFGFLATGTEEEPCNAGMKDQVMALKWIKRSIAAFGGDLDRITIFGMSAGSFSVTAHMVSPLSQDLFNGVIAVSGAITLDRGLSNHLIDLVKTLATGLDCDNDNLDEIVKCLRTKSLEEILSIEFNSNPCPNVPWWPVVQPGFGQERFLEYQPNYLFQDGNLSLLPIIIGIVADEFADSVPAVFLNLFVQLKVKIKFLALLRIIIYGRIN